MSDHKLGASGLEHNAQAAPHPAQPSDEIDELLDSFLCRKPVANPAGSVHVWPDPKIPGSGESYSALFLCGRLAAITDIYTDKLNALILCDARAAIGSAHAQPGSSRALWVDELEGKAPFYATIKIESAEALGSQLLALQEMRFPRDSLREEIADDLRPHERISLLINALDDFVADEDALDDPEFSLEEYEAVRYCAHVLREARDGNAADGQRERDSRR